MDAINPNELCMRFAVLDGLGDFRHSFILRHPEISVDAERDEVLERLGPWHREQVAGLGFDPVALKLVAQVHGNGVAVIEEGNSESFFTGQDGMVSDRAGIMLGIYVADCAAVYLADPVGGAFGLVHSGKKGTESGIAAVALRLMMERFGTRPGNGLAQVSPCIRPPAYEVDFAAEIRRQCLGCGVLPEHFHDCGVCTSSDLRRYYSYRMEKGRTGRMLALLGKPGPAAS